MGVGGVGDDLGFLGSTFMEGGAGVHRLPWEHTTDLISAYSRIPTSECLPRSLNEVGSALLVSHVCIAHALECLSSHWSLGVLS